MKSLPNDSRYESRHRRSSTVSVPWCAMTLFCLIFVSFVTPVASFQTPQPTRNDSPFEPGRSGKNANAERNRQDSTRTPAANQQDSGKQEASPTPETSPEVAASASQIRNLRQQLAADSSLEEAVKTDLTARLANAEMSLSRVEELRKQIESDSTAIDTAGQRSKSFLTQIEELKSKPKQLVDSSMQLADVELLTTNKRALVDKVKQDLAKNEAETTRRLTRRQEIRAQQEAVEKKLVDVQINLKTVPADDVSLPTQVRRTELQTQQMMLEAEKKALTTELEKYDIEKQNEYLKNQREFLTLQLSREQEFLAELEKLLTRKRQQAAEEITEKARQAEEQNQVPLLVASYEQNTEIAKRTQEIEKRASDVKKLLDGASEEYTTLSDKYRESQLRVRTIGLTGSIGIMLRKRKTEIPKYDSVGIGSDKLKTEIDDVQYEIFEVNQKLEEMSPLAIREEIEEAYGVQNEQEMAALETQIKELISAREEKLEAKKAGLDRLFEHLLDLEFQQKSLKTLTREFQEYINERILWIRSNDFLFSRLELDEGDRQILRSKNWVDATKKIWGFFLQSPAIYLLVMIVCIVLIGYKRKLTSNIDMLGETVARISCRSFWPTVRALALTLAVAMAIPLVPLAISVGIRIQSTPDDRFVYALGTALLVASCFAIPLEIFRRMCRPTGLGRRHFHWPDYAVNRLRRNLQWITVPGSMVVFSVTLLRNLDVAHQIDFVERVLYLVGIGMLFVFLYRVLNPKTGLFSQYLNRHEYSWATQTSGIWFSAILLVPISLGLLAVFGYYFTAINLTECLFGTVVLAVVAETTRGMLYRLILIWRRHVREVARQQRLEQQEHERQQQLEQQASEKESAASTSHSSALTTDQGEGDGDRQPATAEEGLTGEAHRAPPTTESILAATAAAEAVEAAPPEVEIDEIATQVNKLVTMLTVLIWGIGIWMIWIDVLPALRALDEYTLWKTESASAAPAESAASPAMPTGVPAPTADAPKSSEASKPASSEAQPELVDPADARRGHVSLHNLLVFLLIIVVTVIAARRLPSAVEMLFPADLPLDQSYRYAIKALVSYLIVVVGVILAFRELSITWTNVQWLATALTFGLAFGLQEIFANFVAGLILMLERPIRIGDLVTVDDFTGVVTRIRTRATTVVNWDRKENVIPNKDLITGRFVNWTLSDTVNRVVLTVGIAYGSDVAKAKSILYEICEANPEVMDEPATSITFELFGDNSLSLVLRCFLSRLDRRLGTIDELHSQINDRFNEAGIEIAFPQRDLHLRTVDGRAVNSISDLVKVDAEKSSEASP